MDARTILLTAAFTLIGGGIAWAYCRLARLSVERITKDAARLSRLLPLMLVRVGLVAGGFVAATCFGGWPAVGNIVGFFATRTVILARTRAELATMHKPGEAKQAKP